MNASPLSTPYSQNNPTAAWEDPVSKVLPRMEENPQAREIDPTPAWMEAMDAVEHFILKQGWPVPFSPYYMVRHEEFFALMDHLRQHLNTLPETQKRYRPTTTGRFQEHQEKTPPP